MKKDEAEKEHREYRIKTARELEIKNQVRDHDQAVVRNLNVFFPPVVITSCYRF